MLKTIIAVLLAGAVVLVPVAYAFATTPVNSPIKVCAAKDPSRDYTFNLEGLRKQGIVAETFSEVDSEALVKIFSNGSAPLNEYQWMVAATASPNGERIGVFIFVDGCFFKMLNFNKAQWNELKLKALASV